MPALQLSEPLDVPLRRSPLSLVVCQVRHERALAVADPRHGFDVQARLGGRYPKIQEHRSLALSAAIALAPGAAPQISQEPPSTGWTMQSEAGTWTVTLDPEFFSVETSAYTTWGDFRARLSDLVTAVLGTYAPGFEVRVGLRYVDEIVHPDVTSPTEWNGWIRDELLGPLAHDAFGSAVRMIQQIVEFDAGGPYRVMLRHGTSTAGGESRWVYLLDHDCFRQAGRPLEADSVLAAADDLHRLALQVFQASITPALYAYLEGEEEDR